MCRSAKRNLAKSFNFTFCYTDDVLLQNNPKFGDYVDYIYLAELEIKDTSGFTVCALYVEIMLEIDLDQH